MSSHVPMHRVQSSREGPPDEGGFVAGAEALIFGVLIFVLGTLIVVNAWSVIDAKFATSAAAREATRAAVAADPSVDLVGQARGVAERTLEGYGRGIDTLQVTPEGATTLARCAEVGFEVSVRVPAVAFIGDISFGDFRVSSRHYELVDPFRSGLEVPPGFTGC